MMDYYSDFPAPPEQEVIKDVVKVVSKIYDSSKKTTIEKCVKEVFDELGGHSALGSYTGYCVFTRNNLIERSIEKMKTFRVRYLQFRTVVKIIIILERIYVDVLHQRYKPNGQGYYEARKDFIEKRTSTRIPTTSYLKESLPPIGNKKLNRPIKDYYM